MTRTTGTQAVRGVDRGWVLPEDEGVQEARGADVVRDTGFGWRGRGAWGSQGEGRQRGRGQRCLGAGVWPGPSCGGGRSLPLTEGPCSPLPLVLGRCKPWCYTAEPGPRHGFGELLAAGESPLAWGGSGQGYSPWGSKGAHRLWGRELP